MFYQLQLWKYIYLILVIVFVLCLPNTIYGNMEKGSTATTENYSKENIKSIEYERHFFPQIGEETYFYTKNISNLNSKDSVLYLNKRENLLKSSELFKKITLDDEKKIKFNPLDENGQMKLIKILENERSKEIMDMKNRYSRNSKKEQEKELEKEKEIEELCKRFTEDEDENRNEENGNQVFYSPNYPNNYTTNLECTRTITAPKGKVVKLDFRGYFELEPSPECQYDFLEVRDGGYGYSQLINKYCGHEFPPMIVSKGRSLWLRFVSDDNFVLRGFKAVYTFINQTAGLNVPDMDNIKNLEEIEGFIRTDDIPKDIVNISRQYQVPLEYMWIVTAKPGYKILLTFSKFQMCLPNNCEENFVDIFHNKTNIKNRAKLFCGSIADSVTSDANKLFVRFVDKSANLTATNFSSFYTIFRDKGKDKECKAGEFDCEDNKCISDTLRCNGRNNCQYKWDEDDEKCKKEVKMTSLHIIIVLVVFSMILTGMCAAFIYKCARKLIRDHKLIQEHIRQSRENQLDKISGEKSKSKSKEDLKKSTISLIPPSTNNIVHHKTPIPIIDHTLIHHNANKPRSRSNSTQSSSSQRFIAANCINAGRTGDNCYVPGGEMIPILQIQKSHENSIGTNTNGDIYPGNRETDIDGMASQPTGNEYGEHDDQLNDLNGSEPQPEMCDSACQTRESLFSTNAYNPESSSEHSASPVPPSTGSSILHHGYNATLISQRYQQPEHHRSHSKDSRQYGFVPQPEVTPPYGFKGHEGSQQRMYAAATTPRDSHHHHHHHKHHEHTSPPHAISVSPPAPFSTFGYKKAPHDPTKFRAEVAIKMDSKMEPSEQNIYDPTATKYGPNSTKYDPNIVKVEKSPSKHDQKRRPYSVETTKSAPDVIVTH